MKFTLYSLVLLNSLLTTSTASCANVVNTPAIPELNSNTAYGLQIDAKTAAIASPEQIKGCIKAQGASDMPGIFDIPFERLFIPRISSKARAEGYWATNRDPALDENRGYYTNRLPFPHHHDNPWPGEDDFLKKLLAVEQAFEEFDKKHRYNDQRRFKLHGGRAYSPSRLEFGADGKGIHVGCAEYQDLGFQVPNGSSVVAILWPKGYSTHYLRDHHVRPSLEFYLYIMRLALPLPERLPNR